MWVDFIVYSAIKLRIEMSSCEAGNFGKATFPHSLVRDSNTYSCGKGCDDMIKSLDWD